jgi:hypothetical protein
LRRASAAARLSTVMTMANVTPLEVMTSTMMAMWNAAHSGPTLDLGLATQACSIAEKCAPYVHPKLLAAAVRTEVSAAEGQLPPEEFSLWARQQVRAAFGMEPLTIEHKGRRQR